MTRSPVLSILLLLLAPLLVAAQFGGGFFEHLFQGGGHDGHHQQRQQDVGSDSSWYRQVYAQAHCSKYLCPGTLSCVDKATHCPCAFPNTEVKFELSDGSVICVSKTGKPNSVTKKVELARKGLL
ncbi:Long chronological lifespan protein 2 [Orbilia blumenaviensis]|uniref:Long chronological lifespan protein 2 n=1 Tax=Orbilia blumenaviensis TaxID=1796055 RepID=A0AAV9U0K8_9PEZI